MKINNEILKSIEAQLRMGVNPKVIAADMGCTFQNVYDLMSKYLPIDQIRAERKALKREAAIVKKAERQKLKEEKKRLKFFAKYSNLTNFQQRKNNKIWRKPINGVSAEVLKERERTRLYNEANALRTFARRITIVAIEKGYIVPGVCSVCGCTQNIEAHHLDYLHPFEIIWACREHHNQVYHSGDNWYADRCKNK